MPALGKILIITGAVFALLGVLLMFSEKIPYIGKLPGDIHIKRDNVEVHVPITTSILISVVLSLIVWVVSQFKGR